jgi:hypothetical protein
MATGKKSFVAYADWKNTFDGLDNENAGALIKHIFAYVNDENPISDSVLIRAIFANIKATLKRDLNKWDTQLLQRSEAGKRSAELRAFNKLNERSTVVDSRARNPTVSDSVSVSDSVNEIKNNISLSLENDFNFFWDKYGKKNDSKKCKDKFIKLKRDEIDIILKVVESYVNSTPDLQYRKNPLTWLNGKCWNDIEVNKYLPTKDKPFGRTNQI